MADRVNLGARPQNASIEQRLAWCEDALTRIASSMGKSDPAVIASNFKSTGVLTPTRTLDLAAPTVGNISQVLGTLVNDFAKGGAKR